MRRRRVMVLGLDGTVTPSAGRERAIASIGATVLDLCAVPDAIRPAELRTS